MFWEGAADTGNVHDFSFTRGAVSEVWQLLEPREFSPVELIFGKFLNQVLMQFFSLVARFVAPGGQGKQKKMD
jgi:hypothetical protein